MSRVINATDVVRTAKALARAGKTESALHLLKYHAPVASKPDALRHRKVTTKTVDEELITDPHDDEDDDDTDPDEDDEEDEGALDARHLGPSLKEFTATRRRAAKGRSIEVNALVARCEQALADPRSDASTKKIARASLRHVGAGPTHTIQTITEAVAPVNSFTCINGKMVKV